MQNLKFVLISFSMLLMITGCQTIKDKTDEIIEKENKKLSGKVVTKLSLLKNYCPAEEYHQRYLEKR